MRIFRPIIEAFVLAVLDARQDLALRCTITGQFIGDDHPRHVQAPFEQFTEKPLGCVFVATALHEDIEHGAVLVDRPPEVGRFAIDRQEDLVEVPLVSRPWTSPPELIRILLTELERPATDGFVAEDDASGCHQFFDITKAERKAVVQPERVTDDFRRVAMTLIGRGSDVRLHNP